MTDAVLHTNGTSHDADEAAITHPAVQRGIAARTYPHKHLDAVAALDALVAADGNLVLASHELKASPQSILASVVGDANGHDLLARYLRAYTMSKTFGLVAVLNDELHAAILEGELPAKELAKTLVSLVQGMANLTDTAAPPNIDPFTALMKVLPAEEREALKALVPHLAPQAPPQALNGVVQPSASAGANDEQAAGV